MHLHMYSTVHIVRCHKYKMSPLQIALSSFCHRKTFYLLKYRDAYTGPIKQLLPGKWHYRWREQLLPEQLITRNLWYRSIISLHVHHAYLNIAQNIWVYSTLTHRVGGLGFFQFRASPLTPWLGWIVLKILRILPPNFCAFSAANVGAFFKCRLFP